MQKKGQPAKAVPAQVNQAIFSRSRFSLRFLPYSAESVGTVSKFKMQNTKDNAIYPQRHRHSLSI